MFNCNIVKLGWKRLEKHVFPLTGNWVQSFMEPSADIKENEDS